MDKQIVYYYQRGVASYLIAKRMGMSNTKVRAILKKHGVKLRSHNITNKVSAARRTPEQNKAITQKATQANVGSTHTSVHRVRLALARQRKPNIDEVYERPLLETCQKIGVIAIPQKAFYKYNVDLYLPDKNVVIEIFGGNFHNKPQAVTLFRNKMKYLSSKNVPVLIVWADKHTYNPQAVLEAALRASEPLTVVDGAGNSSVRGLGFILND